MANCWRQLIAECIRVKADVVSADEREGGERRILNFGHTVGHALEAETGYKHLLHGEAVGWGMIAACAIGEQMKLTDRETAQRIVDLVRAYGPLPKVDVNAKRVFKRLLSDKKTVGGVPHFILATAIGKVEVVNNVSPQIVIEAVKDLSAAIEEIAWQSKTNPRAITAQPHRGRGAGGRKRRSVGIGCRARHVHLDCAALRPAESRAVDECRSRVVEPHRAHVLRVLRRPDAQVLDLCCGTGDMTFALHRRMNGGELFGADFSHAMLVRAEQKSGSRKIKWIEADALNLPFASDQFQLVTSAFGFRNLANYDRGLAEIFRVLAPGGEIGILDFGEPKGLIGKIYRLYFKRVLPAIGTMISGVQRSVRVSAGIGAALPCS